MKKLLLTSNVVLLLVILSMAFQRKESPTAAQAFQTCIDCTDDNFQGLTGEELLTGISRYGTTHADVIDRQPYPLRHHITDARACWFSVDTLKKFVCLIEKYSKKLNLPSSELGIRFYYAVYPDANSKHLWNKAYASRHTLFMVPTYNNKKLQADIDFDPRYSSLEKSRQHLGLNDSFAIRDIAQLYRKAPRKGLMIIAADPLMSDNQGGLCPPTCPGGVTELLQRADSLHIGYTN